jgi:type II secretory pathway component PulJ
MSFSPLVLALLVASWVLSAVLVVSAYNLRGRFAEKSRSTREMSRVLKGLRADVGQFDVDVRRQGWRHENWGGPAHYVEARMTESSHEVMVLTPYAEASVRIGQVDAAPERRRCSLCLN